jgi:hypothetical protein
VDRPGRKNVADEFSQGYAHAPVLKSRFQTAFIWESSNNGCHMPRYALQYLAGTFTVSIDVTLSVWPQPNTQTFQSAHENMMSIRYLGPSIGFGGNGINFTARGLVLGDSRGAVDVEIGFVQSLLNTQTFATYQAVPMPRFVRRVQPNLPVKDGAANDIWYKTDAVKQFPAGVMAKLGSGRWGPMQGLGFVIKTHDQVKSTFPLTFPGTATAISNFSLTRDFTTAVAVRVRPTGTPAQIFCLEQVDWQASYVGAVAGGIWAPNPAGHQYYNVQAVQQTPAPYLIPPTIPLAAPVANTAEVAQRF